jgi:hypothetical protein
MYLGSAAKVLRLFLTLLAHVSCAIDVPWIAVICRSLLENDVDGALAGPSLVLK